MHELLPLCCLQVVALHVVGVAHGFSVAHDGIVLSHYAVHQGCALQKIQILLIRNLLRYKMALHVNALRLEEKVYMMHHFRQSYLLLERKLTNIKKRRQYFTD